MHQKSSRLSRQFPHAAKGAGDVQATNQARLDNFVFLQN